MRSIDSTLTATTSRTSSGIQDGERGPRRVDAPRLQELTQAAPAQTGIIPESRSCLGDSPPVFDVHIAAQPSRDVQHIPERWRTREALFPEGGLNVLMGTSMPTCGARDGVASRDERPDDRRSPRCPGGEPR